MKNKARYALNFISVIIDLNNWRFSTLEIVKFNYEPVISIKLKQYSSIEKRALLILEKTDEYLLIHLFWCMNYVI